VLDGAPGLARVGVFVDAAEADILATARALTLSVLQLHGSESPAQVAALRAAGPWRVWKAVRPRSADDFRAALERYARVVDGVLVDGWSAEAAGGAGAMFSWNEVARLRPLVPAGIELIVAGGLHPENVAAAIVALRPDAVDVSSGVEETRGIKSEERLRAFVAAARAAAGAVEQEQA
jgi:phosphoribosylanthranilate isomerase